MVKLLFNTMRGRGILFDAYIMILAKATRFCYKISRCTIVGRIVGELLLIAVVLAWAGWPCVLVWKAYSIYFLAGPITLGLLYRSRSIVMENWGEQE